MIKSKDSSSETRTTPAPIVSVAEQTTLVNRQLMRLLSDSLNLVRLGISPHMPLTYGASTCRSCDYSNEKLKRASRSCHVLFVELENGDLRTWLNRKGIKDTACVSWMAQTIMALLAMQVFAGVKHNDLHWGNMLWRQAPKGWWKHEVTWSDGRSSDVFVRSKGELWVLWDFGKASRDQAPSASSNEDLSRIFHSDDWQRRHHGRSWMIDTFGHLMSRIRAIANTPALDTEATLRKALELVAAEFPNVLMIDPRPKAPKPVLESFSLNLARKHV